LIDATGDGVGHTLQYPHGLAVDATGNVFVSDQPGHLVFRIDTGGGITVVLTAAGDGAGHTLLEPGAMVTDPAGNLYVAGERSHNVFRVSPGGVVTENREFVRAPRLAELAGARRDGNLYVGDFGGYACSASRRWVRSRRWSRRRTGRARRAVGRRRAVRGLEPAADHRCTGSADRRRDTRHGRPLSRPPAPRTPALDPEDAVPPPSTRTRTPLATARSGSRSRTLDAVAEASAPRRRDRSAVHGDPPRVRVREQHDAVRPHGERDRFDAADHLRDRTHRRDASRR